MVKNPFGNPDGSRTKIEDLLSDFVDFGKPSKYKFDDSNTRVIVGAKGSGKTVYLRRIKANVESNDSVYSYTADIDHELPTTSLIIKFSQFFEEINLTERWQQLWQCAILRALVSHILCADELKSYLTPEVEKFLSRYIEILYPEYIVRMSIYAEVRGILEYYTTKNTLETYFNLSAWDELKSYLKDKVLNNFPPIYFFMDCIDEEYGHAPMYWLRCQKGLFYTVMRMLRNNTFGNRVHIIISIRDQVLSSVFRSEHETRYNNDDHIRILKWNYNSISYFLDEKIKNLDNEYFKNSSVKSLENWLQLEKISNFIRDIDEPIKQYILRHTRMIPRDVIIIGNYLSKLTLDDYSDNDSYQKGIRAVIARASTTFGNELLKLCANQILNDDMPNTAGRREFSEVYTSIQEYNDEISSILKSILLRLPSDRFSYDDILKVKAYIETIKKDYDYDETSLEKVFDVLWQNGAIGYINNGANGEEEVFFVDNEYENFLLPKDKKEYIIRSCILDSIGFPTNKVSKKPVMGGSKYD